MEARHSDFLNWYTKNLEKEKDTIEGKLFLKMLKENPQELAKRIQPGLFKLTISASLELSKPITMDLEIGHTLLVDHLTNHFSYNN